MEKAKKLVIWGDSLARGVIYDEQSDRYRISSCAAVNAVAEATGMEIVNRARMGMTADRGFSQMETDLARGIAGDAALIEFGGNDADFDWRAISEDPRTPHRPKTPLAVFEEKLRGMIGLARARGMDVLLCTLPPVLSDRYFAFFSRGGLNQENVLAWLGDKDKIYRYHERYSLLTERLAREYDCRLLDVRSAFLEKWDPHPYYCRDGIHPNDAGQKLITDAVLAGL